MESSLRYEKVPIDPLEESLLTDGLNTRKKRQEWQHSYAPIGIIILCLLAGGLMATNIVLTIREIQSLKEVANMACNAGTTTGNQPKDSQHLFQKQYLDDLRYMSLAHEFDYLWQDDFAANTGIIDVPEPERVAPEYPVGAIGMFHELHCLSYLRKALQNATEGLQVGLDWQDNEHWPHCLWYLRQSILCNADPTIELPFTWDGVMSPSEAISGAWDKRQCRDSESLYQKRAYLGVYKPSNASRNTLP